MLPTAWRSQESPIMRWFQRVGWRLVIVLGGVVVVALVVRWAWQASPYFNHSLSPSGGETVTSNEGPNVENDLPLASNNPSVLGQEYETKDKSIEGGDLVALSTTITDGIVKTNQAYHPGVIGVVGQANYTDTKRTVVTAGEIPVKVTTENGEIQRGDFVVPGDRPGYGMKACGPKYCRAGLAIGIASGELVSKNAQATLQPTNNATPTPTASPTPSGKNDPLEAKIKVTVQLRWFEPQLEDQLKAKGSNKNTKLQPSNGLPWQIIDDQVMNVFYDVVSRKFVGTFGDFNIFNTRSLSVGTDSLLVDDKGNLTTAGAVTVKGKTQLQGEVVLSNKQAGNTTIPAGKTNVVLNNRLINKDSVVMVTLRAGENAAKDGLTTSVEVKDGQCTIFVNKTVSYDVGISWFVVNVGK